MEKISMLRVPEALKERFRIVHKEMETRLGDIHIDMSRVLRTALERGLDTIERELKLK